MEEWNRLDGVKTTMKELCAVNDGVPLTTLVVAIFFIANVCAVLVVSTSRLYCQWLQLEDDHATASRPPRSPKKIRDTPLVPLK